MTTDTILQEMAKLHALYCYPFALLDESGKVISFDYCWKNETAHQLYDNLRKMLTLIEEKGHESRI